MKVYVVGFVSDGGVGGFEWRWKREDAEQVRAELATPDTDITNVREVDVCELPGDQITDWLNACAEIWEPREGEGR